MQPPVVTLGSTTLFNALTICCRGMWRRLASQAIGRPAWADSVLLAGLYLLPLMLFIRLLFSVWQYANEVPAVRSEQASTALARATPLVDDAGRWQAISQQYWFGRPMPGSAPAIAQADVPLKAILRGITWGTRAAAVIEEEGQQQRYQVGESLAFSQAEITHISPDRVRLRHAGKTRELMLADPTPGEVMAANAKSAETSTDSRAVSASASAIPPAVRQILVQFPQQTFNYFRLYPARQGSQPGFEIMPSSDRVLFDAAGLQAGDVLATLEGRQFTGPQHLVSRMAQLGENPTVRLTVLRHGQTHQLTLDFR